MNSSLGGRLALLLWGMLGWCMATHAFAFDAGHGTSTPAAVTATVRVLFTPQDDAAGQIVAAVRQSHRQLLVQAFSFTHKDIAQALIDAHRRGVEVKLITDREQTEKMDHGLISSIAAAGVPVWLDGEHQSAHNKVMVIDAGTPNALVVTGSFNFTRAAQYKNAENIIFLGGSGKLADTYAGNWQSHFKHSKPLLMH
jgi:phosphatidylserine/phosphatidylglycerophosphate/cardiolipin synthase-like enzyme